MARDVDRGLVPVDLRIQRPIVDGRGNHFVHQRERFLSALVRPLIWLFIFAAGFRQTLGVSIIQPYTTYVLYETFVTPGLVGMILLFNAMQSSLSMVYDREMGSMRVLLAKANPDLAMGDDLLKKTGAGNLFMVFGEPDVVIETVTVGPNVSGPKDLPLGSLRKVPRGRNAPPKRWD